MGRTLKPTPGVSDDPQHLADEFSPLHPRSDLTRGLTAPLRRRQGDRAPGGVLSSECDRHAFRRGAGKRSRAQGRSRS
jgi:hypothetical protein